MVAGCVAKDEMFTFFWLSPSPFSQWYEEVPFEKFSLRFHSAENWMMWRKAQLFGAPVDLIDRILAANPAEARILGRKVPNFSEPIWHVAARPLVAEGNYAKFTQNPSALRALFYTAGTTLVEASPKDRLWGIGLTADDPRALHRKAWLGRNWLGEVLTEVRDTLNRARTACGVTAWGHGAPRTCLPQISHGIIPTAVDLDSRPGFPR
jgi:ribA/ribD-fused uncharacterized protein